MNEFEYKTLLEKRWRQKLTHAEEARVRAWLAQHPESEVDWNLEARLAEAMDALPHVPVPSNFTARVLEAIEREAGAAQPSGNRMPWFLRVLLPRTAVAAVILGLGAGVLGHQRTAARRAELVRGVKVVAGVSSLPSPEILQDFDTIRQMPASTGPDPELISLLK